jgi:multiple antibiotic resistance protein
MLDAAITAFTIFFVTIDPLGMVPLFVALTHGLTPSARRATAWKSVGLATAILFLFALAGRPLLHYLGVTLASFQIAGGLLLLLVAVEMVLGHSFTGTRPQPEDVRPHHGDVSVFPLAVPLISGPGALTAAMLLHDKNIGDPAAQAVSLMVMAGVLALVWLGFILADRVMGLIGLTGIHIFSRVLGILLTALAINNIIEGLRTSFPAWTTLGQATGLAV